LFSRCRPGADIWCLELRTSKRPFTADPRPLDDRNGKRDSGLPTNNKTHIGPYSYAVIGALAELSWEILDAAVSHLVGAKGTPVPLTDGLDLDDEAFERPRLPGVNGA
jgi:hypothetical protein